MSYLVNYGTNSNKCITLIHCDKLGYTKFCRNSLEVAADPVKKLSLLKSILDTSVNRYTQLCILDYR